MHATETTPPASGDSKRTSEISYDQATLDETSMHAVVQRRYGGPEVLALETVARPEPGPGEVRVRVHAAAVQQGDWHLLTGLPYLIRAAFGLRRPRRPIPGQDLAGVVDAIGPDVTRLRVGDAVYGSAIGGYAEYVCAQEDRFALAPQNLPLVEAAAIPHGGYTALQALRNVGAVRAGHHVLVLGASGAVGSMAVQIGKILGADVTGVCSTRHVDRVRTLGADRVIDYTQQHFAADPARYDLVVDAVGRYPLGDLRRVLRPRGQVVMVAAGPGRLTGGMGRVVRAVVGSIFRKQKFRSLLALPSREDFETLNEWIEAGRLVPQLDRSYPLPEIAEAFRQLENKSSWGRLVVTPNSNPNSLNSATLNPESSSHA